MKKNYETLMRQLVSISQGDVVTTSPMTFPTDENELPFVPFNIGD